MDEDQHGLTPDGETRMNYYRAMRPE
jgi:hypothetical protein